MVRLSNDAATFLQSCNGRLIIASDIIEGNVLPNSSDSGLTQIVWWNKAKAVNMKEVTIKMKSDFYTAGMFDLLESGPERNHRIGTK